MQSPQAVRAGVKVSSTNKILQEEPNKDVPDKRELHSKLGRAEAAWRAFQAAYDTYDSGEEETWEWLKPRLKKDGYLHLVEISWGAEYDVLEFLEVSLKDSSRFLAEVDQETL